MRNYLAVDLGAESGRLILGTIADNGQLQLREIHRFATGMLNINGRYHWNIGNLHAEIVKGIEKCIKEEKVTPDSIGIDTWGVDYGLLAQDGSLAGLPFAYRDSRTAGLIEEFCERMPKGVLYGKTGNMFASYNTLFQLFAAKKYHPKLIDGAADLLFVPDLLTYFLTGEKKTEFSFATTSQLYNRNTLSWDAEIFGALGVSPAIMQEVVNATATVGTLKVASEWTKSEIPMIAAATHDTASAIAAIPFKSSSTAFISSGTWSLMGVETAKPVLIEEAMRRNFTNEGGLGGRNYLLKNLMGLWVLQQVRVSLIRKGEEYDYPTLVALAQKADAFTSFIDIDHPSFMNPEDMCAAIASYCSRTGQRVPANAGEMARVVMESLALKYRETIDDLMAFTPIDSIAITGGGINNKLLCQLTANACGVEVTTCLAEGTAAGNILAQALGLGDLKSEAEIVGILEKTCTPSVFQPQDVDAWEDAYSRYKRVAATPEAATL